MDTQDNLVAKQKIVMSLMSSVAGPFRPFWEAQDQEVPNIVMTGHQSHTLAPMWPWPW